MTSRCLISVKCHAPNGRVTFKVPARPAGARCFASVACSPFMTAHRAGIGWENRREALAEGFISVGWAVELSPEQRSGA
jgi:hypothetical protein